MNETTIPRVKDDWTPEQRERLTVGILARDTLLSRLGGRTSYACWACEYRHARTVEAWVRSRSEMRNVRQVRLGSKAPRVRGLLHIYDVEDGHPALGGGQ